MNLRDQACFRMNEGVSHADAGLNRSSHEVGPIFEYFLPQACWLQLTLGSMSCDQEARREIKRYMHRMLHATINSGPRTSLNLAQLNNPQRHSSPNTVKQLDSSDAKLILPRVDKPRTRSTREQMLSKQASHSGNQNPPSRFTAAQTDSTDWPLPHQPYSAPPPSVSASPTKWARSSH